jgi:hypothetical protein
MLIFRDTATDLFAGGMTSFLYERQIRIFDYPKFAERSADELLHQPLGLRPPEAV